MPSFSFSFFYYLISKLRISFIKIIQYSINITINTGTYYNRLIQEYTTINTGSASFLLLNHGVDSVPALLGGLLLAVSDLPVLQFLVSLLQLFQSLLLPLLYLRLQPLVHHQVHLLQRSTSKWVSLVVEQVPFYVDTVDHLGTW